jgi:L-cysteine:1D-myo-inositol 2-amino-2-deoxy-alpha-D-glucopyranoside ligase
VWLHVGMVALDGIKMSKSLGNLVFVRDLLARFPGGAIRRYLLEHHYRSGWDYDDRAMQRAAQAFEGWARATGRPGRRPDLEDAFGEALRDDLDTPRAVAVLDEAAAAGAGETVDELAAAFGVHVHAPYASGLST